MQVVQIGRDQDNGLYAMTIQKMLQVMHFIKLLAIQHTEIDLHHNTLITTVKW